MQCALFCGCACTHERFPACRQAPCALIVSHSIHPHRDASRSVGRHSCPCICLFLILQRGPRSSPVTLVFHKISDRSGRKVFPKFRAFKRPRASVLRNLFPGQSAGSGGSGGGGDRAIYPLSRSASGGASDWRRNGRE